MESTPRPNGADSTLKADQQKGGLIQIDPSNADVSRPADKLHDNVLKPDIISPNLQRSSGPKDSVSYPAKSFTIELTEKPAGYNTNTMETLVRSPSPPPIRQLLATIGSPEDPHVSPVETAVSRKEAHASPEETRNVSSPEFDESDSDDTSLSLIPVDNFDASSVPLESIMSPLIDEIMDPPPLKRRRTENNNIDIIVYEEA